MFLGNKIESFFFYRYKLRKGQNSNTGCDACHSFTLADFVLIPQVSLSPDVCISHVVEVLLARCLMTNCGVLMVSASQPCIYPPADELHFYLK